MKRWTKVLTALVVVAVFVAIAFSVFDIQIARANTPYYYTIKIATRIVGTSTWRGHDQFTNATTLLDTVSVPGTLSTDLVFVSWTGLKSTQTITLANFSQPPRAYGLTDKIVVQKFDTLACDTAYNYLIIR